MSETQLILGKNERTYSHCYGKKCPEDYPYIVSRELQCLDVCPEPLVGPMVEDTCAEECGLYQAVDEKRRCYCYGGLETKGSECFVPEGKTWTEISVGFADACVAAKRVASLTGDKCVTDCEENEISNGKQCVCSSDNILHNDRKHCIPKEQCARKRADGDGSICLSDDICTGELKLSLEDERLCVEDCPSWVVDETTKE